MHPPDWWPEQVLHEYASQLMKSLYGTLQAAYPWHVRISTWMEGHGYLEANSEKSISMKHEGEEWIMHGLFVDDIIHASTSDDICDRFICKYQADFISIPAFPQGNDPFFTGFQIALVGTSYPTFSSRSDLWYVPTVRTLLLFKYF